MIAPKHEAMPDDHNEEQTITVQGFHACPT